MSAEARTRFLDITRLAARAGKGPLTGIDRVERAYLKALIARQEPFALICRTALGYLILAAEAAPKVLAWADDPQRLPRAPALAHLVARASGGAGFEAALRALALARVRHGGLGAWLARQYPAGGSYLNVGHQNLSDETLGQLRRVPGLTVAVMIHDTIPLDYPQFSGDRAPIGFRAKLLATLRRASVVLCPSAVVAADVSRWSRVLGAASPTFIAPLGVDVAAPDPAAIPGRLDLTRPYFVALGTIEPRKDHALLLDIWADFHATLPDRDIPRLFILGRRGWKNEAVFRRLDTETFMERTVFEAGGLSDSAVAAVLQGACGLLAPSRAEGFGLPVAEAAVLGVPVLASDLPVTREILGTYPIYAPAGDMYAWSNNIKTLALQATKPRQQSIPGKVPDWTAHFNLVFNRV